MKETSEAQAIRLAEEEAARLAAETKVSELATQAESMKQQAAD